MAVTRHRKTISPSAILALGCCLLLCAFNLGAEEETSTSQQLGATSTAKKTSTKPKSLADYAANAKLKAAAGEQGGKVTISNNSLATQSKTGTLSQGSGLTGAPAPEAPAPRTAGGPEQQQKLQQGYEEQLAKVKAIEDGLADFEARAAQRDPHFSNTVQNRSPGVYSPNDETRKKVQGELDSERKKLDSIRSQAKSEGVELTNPE